MELGQHCSFAPCNRLDFLPFECSKCGLVYCKDHRTPSSHECYGDIQDDRQQVLSATRSEPSHTCSLAGCKKRELVEISYPQCHATFCLAHRHQEQHDCPALSVSVKPPPRAPGQRGNRGVIAGKETKERQKASQRSQGAKSVALQSKVALMKMKMKAEGSDAIPQSERVYLAVQLPGESTLPTRPMFFSKEWSVGKIVDFIAAKFKLRNDNDKPSACKLVLFTYDGEPVVMSETLKNLVETTPSGSTVKLEYQES